MVRYSSLVKQRLGSFATKKLEHISRDLNERANTLVAGVVYYNQPSESDRRSMPFLANPYNSLFELGRVARKQG